MDPNGFESVQQAVEKIDAVVHRIIEKAPAATEAIQKALHALGKALGSSHSVSIGLRLVVTDRLQSRELPIEILTLTSDRGEKPYDSTEESEPQRYLTGDVACVVPRDRCPRCWQSWAHKFQHPRCPHCGLALGIGCEVVIENDQCPQCDDGTVTTDHPICEECGFSMDLQNETMT